MVPIISQGIVTRQQADSFVAEQQVDPMQILQAQQALEQAQAQNDQEPITPDMVRGMTPADMEQIYNAATATQQPGYQDQFSADETMQPVGAMQPTPDMGYDNYQQGIEANASEPLDNLEY